MLTHITEAVRIIYPAIKDGFAYWHTKDDGTPWEDPSDGLVWENQEFEKPSWEQIEAALPLAELREIKQRKIEQVKAVRNAKNIEPITDYAGFLIDAEGNITTEESYFIFYTNRHQTNPASDPDSIISRALDLGAMPYFTKDVQGNKITVQITAEIATSLRQRIAERNNNNYKLSSLIEIDINQAQSKEEVESINLES